MELKLSSTTSKYVEQYTHIV